MSRDGRGGQRWRRLNKSNSSWKGKRYHHGMDQGTASIHHLRLIIIKYLLRVSWSDVGFLEFFYLSLFYVANDVVQRWYNKANVRIYAAAYVASSMTVDIFCFSASCKQKLNAINHLNLRHDEDLLKMFQVNLIILAAALFLSHSLTQSSTCQENW